MEFEETHVTGHQCSMSRTYLPPFTRVRPSYPSGIASFLLVYCFNIFFQTLVGGGSEWAWLVWGWTACWRLSVTGFRAISWAVVAAAVLCRGIDCQSKQCLPPSLPKWGSLKPHSWAESMANVTKGKAKSISNRSRSNKTCWLGQDKNLFINRSY